MSSWEGKLNKKLVTLTDTASKETIQTVANWVAFNRKHYAIVAPALTKSLQETQDNPKRQWLYWQLIHEILIADRDTPTKWEKCIDLRVALGEGLIVAMEQLGNAMLVSTELSDFLKEWESLNVFGGPLLMSQVKQLYQIRNSHSASNDSSPKATNGPPQPTATPIASPSDEASPPPATGATTKAESAKEDPEDVNVNPEVKAPPSMEPPSKRRSSYSQNSNSIEYDFESKVRKKTAKKSLCHA
jgi:hypothetical protein